MQVMHETPALDRQAIRDSFAPPPVTGGILPPPLQSLTAAELADQVEQIKITPSRSRREEISKLWRAFGAHYRPTAAYLASVVLIESRRATRPRLPVQTRQLFVVPFREPRIEEVQWPRTTGEPIVSDERPRRRGRST